MRRWQATDRPAMGLAQRAGAASDEPRGNPGFFVAPAQDSHLRELSDLWVPAGGELPGELRGPALDVLLGMVEIADFIERQTDEVMAIGGQRLGSCKPVS